METYEHGVFISYAWGEEREEIVDQLDRSLQERGIRIIRDKRELEYKGSIKEFMERIGHGDCVIVVVSDKYLRSPNCMFELVEIADNKQFKGRIFPIVLEDANVYEPIVQVGYVGHWEKKIKDLREALAKVERGNTREIDDQLNLYLRIRSKISELTGVLRDMNVLTPSMHRASGFSELYDAIVKRLEESSGGKTPASTSVPARGARPAWEKGKSPFPGLRALGSKKDDEKIFFGREAETQDLLRRLSDPACRFLAVAGSSGSGKSSLVRAGLLPRLRDAAQAGSKDWLVVTFKPDELGKGDPFDSLAVALSKLPLDMEMEEIRNRLLESPEGLQNLLTKHLADDPETRRTLIFIDQFEELFTRVSDENLRDQFQNMLAEVTRPPRNHVDLPRIQTVVTIRNDFLPYCVESRILSPVFNSNPGSTYFLSSPGVWQMYEMIAGPARVAGLQFEAGLEGRILQDTGSDPGALALMAFALEKLYEASTGSGTLTFDAYRKFGGVQGAIGTHATETFEKLPPEEARNALPRVFRELLDVDESGTATRKRAPLDRVEVDKASKEFVRTLDKARLLVSSDGLVEVAHEALFRSWPRLKAWIEEAQDDLILLRQVRTAADWWDKHERRPEFLWPDERLQPAYAMRERLKPDLNEIEQEFIRLEVERLWEEIEKPDTLHRRRSWIGERLDTLGDPRPGVGLVTMPLPLRAEDGAKGITTLRAGEMRLWGDKPEHKGLPDLVWLAVEGGSIKIEKQTFKVQPFFIAKYPISYMQFQAFIDARDGFKDARWWKGLSADKDDKASAGEQNFKFYNHPRENVSWYGAIAFCRWLNARLDWAVLPANLTIKTLEDFKGIRLPTEWEWQWAATGGNTNYEYPWGEEWDGSKVNTSESGLARTTAVGMYPAGSTKCGALDMSGNVWEWCLNEYGKPENIGLSSKDVRVVRGGSWGLDRGFARASYRSRSYPYSRDVSRGFRLVVRPPSL